MLGEIFQDMLASLIKSKLSSDQKIKVTFEPPQGRLIIRHIKKKQNSTYEISFQDIKGIFDKL